MIMVTYLPLNWLWELVFPPKQTKKKELGADEMEAQEEVEAAKAAEVKANLKAEAIEKDDNAAIDLEAENNVDKVSNTSEVKK